MTETSRVNQPACSPNIKSPRDCVNLLYSAHQIAVLPFIQSSGVFTSPVGGSECSQVEGECRLCMRGVAREEGEEADATLCVSPRRVPLAHARPVLVGN